MRAEAKETIKKFSSSMDLGFSEAQQIWHLAATTTGSQGPVGRNSWSPTRAPCCISTQKCTLSPSFLCHTVSSALIRRWNILLWGFIPYLRLPPTSHIPYCSLSHSQYVKRFEQYENYGTDNVAVVTVSSNEECIGNGTEYRYIIDISTHQMQPMIKSHLFTVICQAAEYACYCNNLCVST
jgi:hypothetical protein